MESAQQFVSAQPTTPEDEDEVSNPPLAVAGWSTLGEGVRPHERFHEHESKERKEVEQAVVCTQGRLFVLFRREGSPVCDILWRSISYNEPDVGHQRGSSR